MTDKKAMQKDTVSTDEDMPTAAQQSLVLKKFKLNVSKWVLVSVLALYSLTVLAQIAVAAGLLQAAPISDLINSEKEVLLPIVTLVLGHYFGARQLN